MASFTRSFRCLSSEGIFLSFQVGWLKAKDQTILALHTRVITHNGRIAVDHEESR